MRLKFTKRLKEKWLEALESGKYKHKTGALTNSKRTKHCCLGVLAEVHPRLSFDSSCRLLIDEAPLNPLKGAYAPFHELFGRDVTMNLYRANDAEGTTDYAPAIEIIKELPTKK